MSSGLHDHFLLLKENKLHILLKAGITVIARSKMKALGFFFLLNISFAAVKYSLSLSKSLVKLFPLWHKGHPRRIGLLSLKLTLDIIREMKP